MPVRGLVLGLIALLFAAGAALLARAWMSAHSNAPAIAAATSARAILVARVPLPMGEILKPEALGWQPWPEDGIDPAYILQGTRNPAEFAGWVVRAPVGKGQPVTLDRIVAPGERSFLAAVLRPGMRAVAIPVDATSGIAGFVFPGDQVDILLTHAVPGDNGGEHRVTETILRDVRVLAIDQKSASKQDEPTVVHDVTVEVLPKQSEIVAVGNAMGKLSLSLRSLSNAADELPESDPLPISDPRHQSYTLDTETSRLLGSGSSPGTHPNAHLTVLHGSHVEDVALGDHK